MIERAVAAKVPFACVAGDEVYGDDRRLRVWLGQSSLHFIGGGEQSVCGTTDWQCSRMLTWLSLSGRAINDSAVKKAKRAINGSLKAGAVASPYICLTVPEIRKLLR